VSTPVMNTVLPTSESGGHPYELAIYRFPLVVGVCLGRGALPCVPRPRVPLGQASGRKNHARLSVAGNLGKPSGICGQDLVNWSEIHSP